MRHMVPLLVISVLAGCAGFGSEDEMEIPLTDVPDEVMASARLAVPGIIVTGAEIENEDGQKVYELSGEAGGKAYEIEVSGTGEILEVEED